MSLLPAIASSSNNFAATALPHSVIKSSDRKSCLSRSSLDSGFESRNSLSHPPSSPESVGTIEFKPSSSISPLATVSYNLKPSSSSSAISSVATTLASECPRPFKKPKLLLFDLKLPTSSSSASSTCSYPRLHHQESAATKLINSCTSPKSTKDVRKLLQYCIPSTSSLPTNLKKNDLKLIISEFVDKENGIEEKFYHQTNNKMDEVDDFAHQAAHLDEQQQQQDLPQKGMYGECKCEWNKCINMYETENDLYDHIYEAHLIPLQPKTMASKKEFCCEWSECEMMPTRGDAMKKYDWLVSHCTFKHLPQAQPNKCIFDNCILRFKTISQLNTHIKNVHKDIFMDESTTTKTTKSKKEKKDLNNNNYFKSSSLKINNYKESAAFGFYSGRLIPSEQLQDNFDRRMFDWFHQIQGDTEKMENPCLILNQSKEYIELKGSKKRKAHCKNYFDIIDGGKATTKHENLKKNILLQPKMMEISKTKKVLKNLFKTIETPKIPKSKNSRKENPIIFNGKKHKLIKVKKPNPKQIENSLFKTNEKGEIKYFDAKNHYSISELTLGKETFDKWIKLDDERDAAEMEEE